MKYTTHNSKTYTNCTTRSFKRWFSVLFASSVLFLAACADEGDGDGAYTDDDPGAYAQEETSQVEQQLPEFPECPPRRLALKGRSSGRVSGLTTRSR